MFKKKKKGVSEAALMRELRKTGVRRTRSPSGQGRTDDEDLSVSVFFQNTLEVFEHAYYKYALR